MKYTRKWLALLSAALLSALLYAIPTASHAERIKDIAALAAARKEGMGKM